MAMPSRMLRRTPFTFWLCIRVKSQARRLVPPEILLRNRAGENVLDEIVGSGHVAGKRASIAPQPRDLSFEKPTEITHHSRLWSWQNASRMVRLSEGRRRNLDYSEAQFLPRVWSWGTSRLCQVGAPERMSCP
jgi:hypothetical protein